MQLVCGRVDAEGGQKEEIYEARAAQVILNDLVRDRNYEIVVTPFNSQGPGPASPPATVYVGEAVPTGEPRDVHATAVSSTEVSFSFLFFSFLFFSFLFFSFLSYAFSLTELPFLVRLLLGLT